MTIQKGNKGEFTVNEVNSETNGWLKQNERGTHKFIREWGHNIMRSIYDKEKTNRFPNPGELSEMLS